MGVLYETFDDLIYLLSYDSEINEERYTESWKNLYINRKTGQLVTRSFYSEDVCSIRPGSVSAYDFPMTYERMEKLLKKVENGSKFMSLREDNWESWLVKNNYV